MSCDSSKLLLKATSFKIQIDLIWKRSVLLISTNDVRHEVSTVLGIVQHQFLYVRESLLIIEHGKNAKDEYIVVYKECQFVLPLR